MVFAGVAKEVMSDGKKTVVVPAPGVAEAFLLICKRSGLDPFAKQIYVIEVGGKPTIVTGVDGFRIVAQRSKGYQGQLGPEWWTGRKVPRPMLVDGRPIFRPDGDPVTEMVEEWVDAWVPASLGLEPGTRPVAARVGVWRKGFKVPIWQVVTWKEFGVEPRFKGDNWEVRPAHMLGIRAETHGLRRSFPNDLSGLYTPEDFDEQSGELNEEIQNQVAAVEKIQDITELSRYFQELHTIGMAEPVRIAFMKRAGDLGATPKPTHDVDASRPEEPAKPLKRKGPTITEEPSGIDALVPEPTPKPEGDMTEEQWEVAERARFDAEQSK
jgi:hypothetical protein